MLASLSEQFARRAREFSDAVAKLGQHRCNGPELHALLEEIKRKRRLCEESEHMLARHIGHETVVEIKPLLRVGAP